MLKVLILDDHQERHDEFHERFAEMQLDVFLEHVFTVDGCKEKLLQGPWDLILLDHDLNGGYEPPGAMGTGSEIAVFISEHPEIAQQAKAIVIHSLNPDGALFMLGTIPFDKENVFYQPGFWLEYAFPSAVPVIADLLRQEIADQASIATLAADLENNG